MQATIDRNFEIAAMPHLNALFQTAMRLKRNRREAEFAIEETYAEAWKAFNRGSEWANWRVELFKILCRQVHEMDNTSSNTIDPVVMSLDAIPISLRLPILLIDCHGFTYNQAAEILGLTVETLADRLTQGRDQTAARVAADSSAVASVASDK